MTASSLDSLQWLDAQMTTLRLACSKKELLKMRRAVMSHADGVRTNDMPVKLATVEPGSALDVTLNDRMAPFGISTAPGRSPRQDHTVVFLRSDKTQVPETSGLWQDFTTLYKFMHGITKEEEAEHAAAGEELAIDELQIRVADIKPGTVQNVGAEIMHVDPLDGFIMFLQGNDSKDVALQYIVRSNDMPEDMQQTMQRIRDVTARRLADIGPNDDEPDEEDERYTVPAAEMATFIRKARELGHVRKMEANTLYMTTSLHDVHMGSILSPDHGKLEQRTLVAAAIRSQPNWQKKPTAKPPANEG